MQLCVHIQYTVTCLLIQYPIVSIVIAVEVLAAVAIVTNEYLIELRLAESTLHAEVSRVETLLLFILYCNAQPESTCVDSPLRATVLEVHTFVVVQLLVL